MNDFALYHGFNYYEISLKVSRYVLARFYVGSWNNQVSEPIKFIWIYKTA